MIDFDLMGKCCDGKLLQSCEASSKFICDCGLEHEHSKYHEIFFASVKNGDIVLRTNLFVTFAYLIEI